MLFSAEGCVRARRALFIDRRRYVNSDSGQLLSVVGCPTQARAAYCLHIPAGKKAKEKERNKPGFPLLHTRLSVASHPHVSASRLLPHHLLHPVHSLRLIPGHLQDPATALVFSAL